MPDVDFGNITLEIQSNDDSLVLEVNTETDSLELDLNSQLNLGVANTSFYFFYQVSPALTWTINHNLGYTPVTQVFNDGSREIIAEIINITVNQVMVYFDTPTSGFARLL